MARLKLDEHTKCHITVKLALENGPDLYIDGLLVKMPKDLKDIALVLHTPVGATTRPFEKFVVSEVQTGYAVGYGWTRERAIDHAICRIREVGKERVLEFIEKFKRPIYRI